MSRQIRHGCVRDGFITRGPSRVSPTSVHIGPSSAAFYAAGAHSLRRRARSEFRATVSDKAVRPDCVDFIRRSEPQPRPSRRADAISGDKSRGWRQLPIRRKSSRNNYTYSINQPLTSPFRITYPQANLFLRPAPRFPLPTNNSRRGSRSAIRMRKRRKFRRARKISK